MNFRRLFHIGEYSQKRLLAYIEKLQEDGAAQTEIIEDLNRHASESLAQFSAFKNGVKAAMEYIVWADKTKPFEHNKAHAGKMPPIGSRFLTPREKAQTVLDLIREHLK